MRSLDPDQASNLSASPDYESHAGPSTSSFEYSKAFTNGNTRTVATNGYGPPMTNGNGAHATTTNGISKHGKTVARVNLPGTTLYDDSYIDREEFIRLVIQSLRDVGYMESAATLEQESGYSMETPEVSDFRHYILNGSWAKAEGALMSLGVGEEDGLWEAKFLISQQKYLELLEANKITSALHVLRNELANYNVESDQLHTLSSLIMCSGPEDLRKLAGWDGASGASRRLLLDQLQDYIPSSIMIPQRRFESLLQQSRLYQRQHCLYHNVPMDSSAFSLYADHQCDKSAFPRTTTTILLVHNDEVWNMAWSHDGYYLATCGKDRTAVVWWYRPEFSDDRQWTQKLVFKDHPYPVGCIAWSLDDKRLLTSSENVIKIWNVITGLCERKMENHTDTVTALSWLPDGSGFITGGLDRQIIHWSADGTLLVAWGVSPIRITDLAITPDMTKLVTIGMYNDVTEAQATNGQPGQTNAQPQQNHENKLIVYDFSTRQIQSTVRLEGELTSVKISRSSQYALINHAPDEIQLWDLHSQRLARKYTGQKQGRHVIRSCFGGVEENFVVSGSEDANVYIWHRETGTLLDVLPGHGEGSVNSVAWNPRDERIFASCSDDHSIRIWEAIGPVPFADESSFHASTSSQNGNDKGKTRQPWEGDGVDI